MDIFYCKCLNSRPRGFLKPRARVGDTYYRALELIPSTVPTPKATVVHRANDGRQGLSDGDALSQLHD